MNTPRSNSWKGQTPKMAAAAKEASRQLASRDVLILRLNGVSVSPTM